LRDVSALDPWGERLAALQVLVVVSDFAGDVLPPRANHQLGPRTRVVMVHEASTDDDPDEYTARRRAWERGFREGRASVCQIPLSSLSRSDLESCLADGS
jgi:hypothetical protein